MDVQASWEVMQPLLASRDFAWVAGAMGVYVGIQQMEYGALAASHLGAMGAFAATGSPFSVAAGRMSFHYGLKGEPPLRHLSSMTAMPAWTSSWSRMYGHLVCKIKSPSPKQSDEGHWWACLPAV